MKRYTVYTLITFFGLSLNFHAFADGAPSAAEMKDSFDYLVFMMGSSNPGTYEKSTHDSEKRQPEAAAVRDARMELAQAREPKGSDSLKFSGVLSSNVTDELREALWGKADVTLEEKIFPRLILKRLTDERVAEIEKSPELRQDLHTLLKLMLSSAMEDKEKLNKTAGKDRSDAPFGSDGKTSTPTESNPPAQPDRPLQHGSSQEPTSEQRQSAPQPSKRAQDLSNRAKAGKKPTAVEIDDNLKKLKSANKDDRWAAADFLADNFDENVLTEIRGLGQDEVSPEGRAVLEATQNARKEENVTKLREAARNASAPIPKEAARREIARRMTSDKKSKWAIQDMPSVRPERAMEFTETIAGADQDKAATTLADVIGTMSDEQLLSMLDTNRKRDVKDYSEKEKLYAQRAALAAMEALAIRGAKVSDLSSEELQKLGLTPAQADEFRKKFKAAYEKKLSANQNFQDKIEQGAHADEAKREEAKKWLLDNYKNEDLMDYLGQQIALGLKGDKEAQRTAENLAKVLGIKDDEGNLVLELKANDTTFAADDKNRSVFLGKDGPETGNVFAGLAGFASRPVDHTENPKELPTFGRNRFQSFDVQPDHKAQESAEANRQFYFTPKDKDTAEKYTVPREAKVVKPSAEVATRSVAPAPKKAEPPVQNPTQPKNLVWEEADRTLVNRALNTCAECHTAPNHKGKIAIPQEFVALEGIDPAAIQRKAILTALWKKTSVTTAEPTDEQLAATAKKFLQEGGSFDRMVNDQAGLPDNERDALKKFFTVKAQ